MAISRSSFEYVQRIVSLHAGIELNSASAFLVESSLLPFARELRLDSSNELIRRMQVGQIGEPQRILIEALTDKETYFFRDLHPFEALKKVVLPELKAARAAKQRLTIWSLGCSAGQEPYSIAMLIREHFPELLSWEIEIIASDVSAEAIEYAATGRYNQLELNRGLPAPLLVKYFKKQGTHWRICQQIQQMVRLSTMNLVDPWPRVMNVDLVLLRYVLRSLVPPAQAETLKAVARRLAPDGYLFLGQGETIDAAKDCFEPITIDKTVAFRSKASAIAEEADEELPAKDETEEVAGADWILLARAATQFRPMNAERLAAVFSRNAELGFRLIESGPRNDGIAGNGPMERALESASRELLASIALTQPLSSSLKEAFWDMLSLELEPIPVNSLKQSWLRELQISAQFTGKLSGSVVLRFEPQLGIRLAAGLLGLPESELTADVLKEILGPLLNATTQKLNDILNPSNLACQFETAKVMELPRSERRLSANTASQTIAFRVDNQPFLSEIQITSATNRSH